MKLPGSGVLIISAVIYLISSYCFAQVYQPSRFEITLKSNDNYFDVLSAEENGVIIFRQTRERSKEGSQWEIIKLDSNLVESWKNYPYFKFEYKYTGYAYADGKFYLLFKDAKSFNKNLQLFVIDLNPFRLWQSCSLTGQILTKVVARHATWRTWLSNFS